MHPLSIAAQWPGALNLASKGGLSKECAPQLGNTRRQCLEINIKLHEKGFRQRIPPFQSVHCRQEKAQRVRNVRIIGTTFEILNKDSSGDVETE